MTLHAIEKPSPGLLSVLKNPAFFIFSLSVIFSQVAFNMLNIVLIFLAFSITSSNFAVSFLIIVITIPQALFSFLGGIVGDAKNKRFILIGGNVIRAAVVALFFLFNDSLFYLYFAAFIISTTTQFYVPAETPIIPKIVKRENLLAANSLFGVFLFGSILVGYILGGPFLRLFGGDSIFIFMAALFLAATVFAYLIPNIPASVKIGFTHKGALKNVRELINVFYFELRTSVNAARKQREIASSVVFLALSQVITLILASIIPDFAVSRLGILAEDVSLILFAPAAFGMICMALIIGAYFRRFKDESLMTVGIFLSSVIFFLLPLIPYQGFINPILGTGLAAFIAGISNAFIFVPSQTIIQTYVVDEYRSKIYGLIFTLAAVIAFVPILVSGIFADIFGVESIFLSLGVLILSLGVRRLRLKSVRLIR